MNPMNVIRELGRNYREHRYYGTNLTVYPSLKEALVRGSLAPSDLAANLRGAVIGKISRPNLAMVVAAPLLIEAQRALASGEGLSWHKMVQNLNPAVIGSAFVAGSTIDIAAAAAQSALAKLGPLGAVVGFIQRPALGYLATTFGMAVGQNLTQGKSLRSSMATSLRSFQPGRDIGQLIGGTVVGVLCQVLFPIAPPLDGILGGQLGGYLGAVLGQWLATKQPFKSASEALRRKLHRWADQIERRGSTPQPVASPSALARPSGSRVNILGVGGTTR